MVLLELPAGALAVTVLLDCVGRPSRGFAGTTSLICAALLGVDLLIAAALPDPSALVRARVDPAAVASLAHWSVALLLLLLLHSLFCAVGTDQARRAVGLAAVVVGCTAVAKAAVALGPPAGGAGGAAAVFFPASLLLGSAVAGMLLGHWYLIAPDLSFRPLRQAVYVVLAAVAVEAVAIGAALGAAGPAARHMLLATSLALPFWLLVVGSGIVVTASVSGLTLHFARIRANQPATAMLYVLIITVLMGVVPAHLLLFETAVAV